MKVEQSVLLLLILPAILLTLISGGCASTESGAYRTLKKTQIDVSWAMTRYRNAAAFGKLSLGERERVNQAYAAYESAFNRALQAAGGNQDAPTPDDVKARADEVIRLITSMTLAGPATPNWMARFDFSWSKEVRTTNQTFIL